MKRIVLVVVWGLLTCVPAAAQQARMKVVLDTDIGTDIDDGWALGYALKSPVFDLVGVTVTDADTPQRARLACKLLQRLGRTEVPGRGRSQDRRRSGRSRGLPVHVGRGFPVVHADCDSCRRVSRRHHSAAPGQITLIAVGPLAEHRRPVRLHPEVVPLVKRVVLMSGSVGRSAWSSAPVAEWNVQAGRFPRRRRCCGRLAADDRAARLHHVCAARGSRSARRCGRPVPRW